MDPAMLQALRQCMSDVSNATTEQAINEAKKLPLAELRAKIRKQLARHDTDMRLNDADTMGDGDQSRIMMNYSRKQVYRDLFATGGDLPSMETDTPDNPFMGEFAMMCTYKCESPATIRRFLECLDAPGHAPDRLLAALETREGSMRLSPLLGVVAFGKRIRPVAHIREAPVRERQLQVCKLLLRFGASSDAKGVCGKTVVHYGAGCMATPTTMAMVRMCTEAAKSCHLFNQQVEIASTAKGEPQWRQGHLSRIDSGRCVVYMEGSTKPVSIKPENLRLVQSKLPLQLVRVQDRLGGTAMLEVLMSNRTEVADFLLDKLQASIDVADWDSFSPRSMAVQNQTGSTVAPIVMRHAMKREQQCKHQAELIDVCSNCGQRSKSKHPFSVCTRCKSAAYCSKDCQVAHWKTHKAECKAKTAAHAKAEPFSSIRLLGWSGGPGQLC